MASSVLFVITGDPRRSPRPAEAIRIAAGIAPWHKSDLTVYLRDAAVLALDENADDLVDGDYFARYLPVLGEAGRPIYVQQGAPLLAGIQSAPVTFEPIGDPDLARLAAKSDCVVRF